MIRCRAAFYGLSFACPQAPVYIAFVTKGRFAVTAVVVLITAAAGWHAAGFTVAALFLFGAYVLSVRVHPRTRHTGWRSCNGTGEHRGTVFGWGHRRCPGCDGGRMIRWGAGHFGTGVMRGEYTARREARQSARDNRTWR